MDEEREREREIEREREGTDMKDNIARDKKGEREGEMKHPFSL